jgi:hypothetical protein
MLKYTGVNAMTASLKTALAVFVLSSALAGAAAPAFAAYKGGYKGGDGEFYRGIIPPGTQSGEQSLLPRLTTPPGVDVTPTGSIDGQRLDSPAVLEEKYKGGDGDYYRGIVPPTP